MGTRGGSRPGTRSTSALTSLKSAAYSPLNSLVGPFGRKVEGESNVNGCTCVSTTSTGVVGATARTRRTPESAARRERRSPDHPRRE
jgi:hypothetical protein